MAHASDDDLILTYYGEARLVDEHLGQCPDCTARYEDLRITLEIVAAADVPDRGEHYGLEVWQRIRHRLHDLQPGARPAPDTT